MIMIMVASVLTSNAQTTVKGMLADSISREGEPYATVRIYNAQNLKQGAQPVAMALTAADGKFSTVVKSKGNFVAIASSVGKTAAIRRFAISNEKEVDLGTLLTTDEESVMKSVEIVAVRPVVKMEADKVTYSVEDDEDSKSMTVLDMLRKVPMVSVDGQDNITVNGQSSFKIYVDGKPNMMLNSNPSQILKAMPASMISNIEVITSPGAKYDAEGAGGILNFTTAKIGGAAAGAAGAGAAQQMNGFNGSLYAQGGNRGAGAGGSISGQQKKLSYSANVTYQYVDNGEVSVDNIRQQKDGTNTILTMKTKSPVPFLMGSIGLGYDINNENQVNVNFDMQRYAVTNSGTVNTRIFSSFSSNSAYQINYGYYTKARMESTAFNGSVDYTHFFDKAHKNSLTAIYQINGTPGTRHNESVFPHDGSVAFQDLITDGDNNTSEHVAQLDIVNTLSAHSKLNYGGKYALRANTSEYYDLDGTVQVPNTDYEHSDQIAAAYVESENRWEKWSAKAGLRYEHTWVEMNDKLNLNDFRKDYGNLVPSATLSHTIGMTQNIGLTYNMRISRPGITYLNPYVDKSQPTSLTYGNKDLEVEKTHNVGLTYSFFSQKIIISSSIREAYSVGGIEQYNFYKDGLMHTTFGNIADRSLTSLNLYAQWTATKTTRVILNGAVTYNYLKSDVLNVTQKGWSGNAMFNVQQTLPKSWILSLIAITNSKSITLQGKNSGMNIGVLSITKRMCKDRLNLSLSGITGLSKGGKIHLDQYVEGDDFTSNTKISVPLTRVQFTAQWTFGNTSKQFKKHQNNIQNDYIEHQSSTEGINSATQVN